MFKIVYLEPYHNTLFTKEKSSARRYLDTLLLS